MTTPSQDMSHEAKRLEILRRYGVLDTPQESTFDDLASLAAVVTARPIAVIAFVDDHRAWYKASLGAGLREIPRDGSFADVVVRSGEFLEVPDASLDSRFNENKWVQGRDGIRFYAGAPLISPERQVIGTLSVMGRDPGQLSAEQKGALSKMACQVMAQLELRHKAMELSREADINRRSAEALEDAEQRYRSIFENVNEGIFQTTPDGNYLTANPMLAKIYGYDSPDDLKNAVSNISDQLYVKPGRREEFARLLKADDAISHFESQIRRKDGSVIWISENARAVRSGDGAIIRYEGTVEDITARKRAEETLQNSEQLFRAVWDMCADGMRLTDESGIILAVNQAFCDMVGMQEGDMVGRHFTAVYDAGPDVSRIVEQYKERFASRTVRRRQEQSVMFRSGRRVEIALSNSFIDNPGKPPVLLSIFHDVTERRRAEDALRQSEVLYHSLVENLPQNIFRKDLEGRITFCNRRYAEELKRPAAELLGKSDFDLFPADLAAKYRHDDRRIMESGETLDAIEEHQTPDGKLYVHVIKTPLRDATGNVTGVQGMFWDVTQERITELALARERELMRSLLENLPDRIYFKDRHSHFLKISHALAEEFGLKDPEDVVGKSDFDFFSKDHARQAYEDEQRIMLTGTPVIGKTEKEDWPDGTVTWALTTKMPLRDEEGKIIGTFGVSRDITKLKDAEEELAKARDQALETARLKAEFLAIMSHEIRTPLNGVLGMTGLLLDSGLTPEQKDFAFTIRSSAEALLDIINDILDFSKIEAKKVEIEQIEFDLREELENAMELMAERAQSKGLELTLAIDDEIPTLFKGDPGRIRQVLLNLVGNAIKFTEEGEVTVIAKPAGGDDHHIHLRLEIRDTGVGIPEAAMSRIFESFTQADTSTTRRYGGTGLGLAISKQLVELMGGQIGVESTVGNGTTFWFVLPLDTLPGGKMEETFPALQGRRVLIVDDNATNRRILEHQTRAWNMVPSATPSAEHALACLASAQERGEPFELLILDMHMPGMDGLELAIAIASDERHANLKMILLTSLGQRLDEATMGRARISAQLLKPARQHRLATALTRALIGESPRQQLNPSTQQAAQTVWNARPLRILIAEDNSANQKVALLQLRKLGLAADTVANGQEAIAAMGKIPYDVILMDCHMPIIDGYEATRKLRLMEAGGTWPARHPVYIVALTANIMDGERQSCTNAGMNDYITKPTRIQDLEAALLRAAAAAPEIEPRPAAPQQPAESGNVLDATVLNGLRDLRVAGEPDPVAELVDLFLEDAPARVKTIKSSLEAQSANPLITASHTLKGSASNLGALQLAKVSAAVEKLARSADFEGCKVLVPQLEEALAATREALLAEKAR